MPAITAALVNELRAKTGLPMMECKKMLTETDGDIEKAIEGFRKKGVKASVTERIASEGRVLPGVSADAKTGAAVEVLCNTDFTAKSDVVRNVMELGVKKLLANPSADLSTDAEIKSQLTAVAQQTGENVQVGHAKALVAPAGGKITSYLYAVTGKIAVLVSVSENAPAELVNNLCLHIIAQRPLALNRDGIDKDLVAKERELAVEAAKATGKPQQIAEKIAEGKLNSFFAERVLLDQEFVRPDVFKGSVSALLKSQNAQLFDYVRMEVGGK